ncbi:unnamed protein product [Closterium sp. NIES-65]|nr:unnamed protein product [Closterium sp. NIES-65]
MRRCSGVSQSLEVLSLGVRSLGVLHLGVLRRLVSSLPGAAVSVVALLVPRHCTLVVVSLSPTTAARGTLAVRVALLELGALLREALELVTLLLELFLLEFLGQLVPEVLVLEGCRVLGVLLLVALELEVLEVLRVLALEVLELLEVLAQVALELEFLELLQVLALEVLELLELLAQVAPELEVLELLRVLALEVLELQEELELQVLVALRRRDCSSLRRHLHLCHRLAPCFVRFFASRLLLVFRYRLAHRCLLLLLTLS